MSNFLTNNPVTRFFKEVMGPAAIMAAGMIGAGAVSTRLMAGCWFRFELLWVALYVIPMVIIANDTASRVGNISGRGMMDMIKTEMSPLLAWFMFVPTFLLNIIVNMGQMSVMVAGTYGMFGKSMPEGGAVTPGIVITTMVLTTITLLIVLFGGFKRLVKVMSGLLLLLLFCFVVVAIKGLTMWQTWIGLVNGLIPTIPDDVQIVGSDDVRRAFTQLMGIAGQALPASVFLSFGYFTSNAEYTVTDIKMAFKKNVLNFGLIWGLFSVVVVVAGATALHDFYAGGGGGLHFSQIERVFDAGNVIAPALPIGLKIIASPIFSLGLLVAGFTTMVSVAMLMVYFCLDIVGKNWKYTKDNKIFRWTLGLWIAVPAFLSPFWQLPAIIKNILAMAGNLVLTPIAIFILMYFINKSKYVKEYTASITRNIILALTLLFALFVTVYQAILMFG
jgi:manganese transport protein